MPHGSDRDEQSLWAARGRTLGGWLLVAVINLVVAGAIIEIILVSLLHAPGIVKASPAPLRRIVQQVYRHFNRALIQFDPNCARYDAEVTYTLRPGVCTFANLEFKTEVHVNRLGVRDDDSDLEAPEVIIIGDSHAMGWGVEDSQTLARVLARKAGMKVLDAAISSYGTVRERMLLDRLDTSRMKVLIVQYTDNDLVENLAFRQHGRRLPIMSQSDYENIVRYYGSQRRYFPGKYIYRVFMKVFRLEQPEPDQVTMEPMTPAKEAELFLDALEHAGRTRLDDVQIVVFEVNEQIAPPRPFIAALEQAHRDSANPPFVQRMLTLNVAAGLKADDFYVLDDHMRASGHEKVGAALAELIQTRLPSR
jgi:hypothetical protein